MNRSCKPICAIRRSNDSSQQPVADPEESQVRNRRAQRGASSSRSSWPLRWNSRAIVPTTTCSSSNPELATNFFARHRRIQERRGLHPAVDRHVLLGPADSGGQRLLAHRVGDADDLVA